MSEPEKPKRKQDPELAAMTRILRTLDALDDYQARQRVLGYVARRVAALTPEATASAAE